jgi:hypothetical protein
MALFIPAQGAARELHPAHGDGFRLDELQSLVGGFIEVRRLHDGRLLVMNEDGKALGLPVNAAATALFARSAAWADVVVGDVVICNDREMQ